MAEEIYHVILVEADGEIIIIELTKKELIAWLDTHTNETTKFVEALTGGVDNPLEWLEDLNCEEGSAMLIIKGGKIVVPDITKKVDYRCNIE
ncbi:hypothetical protein LCGC14_0805870 [marine sediment metagenome]|uniref:Uncharacterized protein n=1 Tax=marine sediment metagenome TaxID=412755 RepID=A0A0F9SVJ3_9ZZZZ